jgi:hypothetical protein
LGSAEFEKSSAAVLYSFRLQMIEASRRQSSIRRMNDYVMAAKAIDHIPRSHPNRGGGAIESSPSEARRENWFDPMSSGFRKSMFGRQGSLLLFSLNEGTDALGAQSGRSKHS